MGAFGEEVEHCLSEYDLDGWTGDTWAFEETAGRAG